MNRQWLVALLVCGLCAANGAAAKMLQAGETFPSWELPDQSGAMVTSSQLAGKTYLLWFYPKAMTSGCTAEGDGLRDQYSALESKHVTVLGVSFDDPKTNAEFAQKEHFPFQLLSDSDHKLAVAVGAASFAIQPVASRVSYLVGPDGKVLKAYDSVTPATHATQILADLPPVEAK